MNGMDEKNTASTETCFEKMRAALIERLRRMDEQGILNLTDYVKRLEKGNPESVRLTPAQERDFKLKLSLFMRAPDYEIVSEYSKAFEEESSISAKSVTGYMFDGFCLGYDAAFDLLQNALQ